jgi:hypothetical protein
LFELAVFLDKGFWQRYCFYSSSSMPMKIILFRRREHSMKKVSAIFFLTAILITGFVAIYEFGKSAGFRTGSEWALVQADIAAREAGVFMPVYLKEGKFRVVIKQPRGIYKRAWQLADQFEEQQTLKTAKLNGTGIRSGADGKQADL